MGKVEKINGEIHLVDLQQLDHGSTMSVSPSKFTFCLAPFDLI